MWQLRLAPLGFHAPRLEFPWGSDLVFPWDITVAGILRITAIARITPTHMHIRIPGIITQDEWPTSRPTIIGIMGGASITGTIIIGKPREL